MADDAYRAGRIELDVARRVDDGATPCMSCGGPYARRWSTPDGAAVLCPSCATLHGLGCP